MNAVKLKWSFRCKRYPDGIINKFKARLSDRGFK